MQQQRHHPRPSEPRPNMRPTLWAPGADESLAERIGQRIIFGSWIVVLTAATLATAYRLIRKIIP